MSIVGKRVAVTGAAGYIGQNLVAALAAKGADVVQLDLEYGVDVSEQDQWEHKMDGVTHIVHLAAISGIKACEEAPIPATMSNVVSTVLLSKFASMNGIQMIMASSQAAAAPSGVYSHSKSICENIIKSLNAEIDWGAEHKILRFANIFGGGGYLEKKSSVVSAFIKGALKDGVIRVDGDGTQERDFVAIGVVIDSIVKIIERDGFGFPETIDVGTGTAVKIIDLAERVFELAPGDCEIIHSSGRSVGVASNVANPTAIIEAGIRVAPGALDEYLRYVFANVKAS